MESNLEREWEKNTRSQYGQREQQTMKSPIFWKHQTLRTEFGIGTTDERNWDRR